MKKFAFALLVPFIFCAAHVAAAPVFHDVTISKPDGGMIECSWKEPGISNGVEVPGLVEITARTPSGKAVAEKVSWIGDRFQAQFNGERDNSVWLIPADWILTLKDGSRIRADHVRNALGEDAWLIGIEPQK